MNTIVLTVPDSDFKKLDRALRGRIYPLRGGGGDFIPSAVEGVVKGFTPTHTLRRQSYFNHVPLNVYEVYVQHGVKKKSVVGLIPPRRLLSNCFKVTIR